MRHPACEEYDRDRIVFPPQRRIVVMVTLGMQIAAMIAFSVIWFA